MDYQGPVDHQAQLVRVVNPESKVVKENQVCQDLKVSEVKVVLKAQQVKQVHVVTVDYRDQLDRPGHQV